MIVKLYVESIMSHRSALYRLLIPRIQRALPAPWRRQLFGRCFSTQKPPPEKASTEAAASSSAPEATTAPAETLQVDNAESIKSAKPIVVSSGSESPSTTTPKEAAPPEAVTPPPTTASNTHSSRLAKLQSLLEESSGLTALTVLKQNVHEASDAFDDATAVLAAARRSLDTAQTAHDRAHKKHVSLLVRRDEWNADDAQAFVSVTSREVATKQALRDAQTTLHHAETTALQRQQHFMDVMRQRYHEEQLWQDKWRLLGTYGTWSLIAINTLVFGGTQYYNQQREQQRMQHLEDTVMRSISISSSSSSTRRTSQQQSSAAAAAAAAAVDSGEQQEQGQPTSSTSASSSSENTTSGSVDDESSAKEATDASTGGVALLGEVTDLEATTLQQRVTAVRHKCHHYLEETRQNLHPPSVTLGAVVGLTCGVALSISVSLLRRR